MLNHLKAPELASNCTLLPTQGSSLAAAMPIQRSALRFGAACLLAGGVTLGLFVLMQVLIYVKDIRVVEGKSRILTSFVPMHKDEPVKRTTRQPVKPQDVAVPPPLPATSMTSAAIDLPAIEIAVSEPALPQSGAIGPILPQSVVLERPAEPLSPPNVLYPRPMAEKGISGSCEVKFSLTVRGLPFDPVATCTHAGFESAAKKAVMNAEFLPQIGPDGPIEAHGMIYPIDFQLN